MENIEKGEKRWIRLIMSGESLKKNALKDQLRDKSNFGSIGSILFFDGRFK